MFSRADFEALAELMGSVAGKMLMSINDVEGVRTLFKDFSIEPIEVTYTVARKETARGKRGELLIRNW